MRILNYSHLIALVLVTLFLFNQTSHSQLQQDTSSVVWETYTNVNQGYKIQYPSSWSLGAEDSVMDADLVSTVNIGLKEKLTGRYLRLLPRN